MYYKVITSMKRYTRSLKQSITFSLMSLFLAFGIMAVVPGTAAALAPPTTTFAAPCSDIKNAEDRQKFNSSGQNCLFEKYINPFIRFLSAFAGIAIAGVLMYGSFLYTSAGGDPGKVTKAKSMISKGIIALLCLFFMAAFLNWIVPGGITGRG